MGKFKEAGQEKVEDATRIIKCTCNHPYQDSKYGFRKRLANKTDDGCYRCTVCDRDVRK